MKWYYHQNINLESAEIVGVSSLAGLRHLQNGSPYNVVIEINTFENKTFKEVIALVTEIIGTEFKIYEGSYWDEIGSLQFKNPDRGLNKRPRIRKDFEDLLPKKTIKKNEVKE